MNHAASSLLLQLFHLNPPGYASNLFMYVYIIYRYYTEVVVGYVSSYVYEIYIFRPALTRCE